MHSFNIVDLVIIAVIALSVIISLVRGFVREALSLAGWGIAIWVALSFANVLSLHLQAYIAQPLLRLAAAFAILFIATLIMAAMVNHLVSTLVKKTGLSGTDRLLGVIFGLGRGVLLVSLLLLLGRLTPMPEEKSWQQSSLVPTFLPVEQWLVRFLPEDITAKLSGAGVSVAGQTSNSQIPSKVNEV